MTAVRAVLVLGLCDERDRWVKDPQKLQNGQLLGITSLAELQREHAKLAALIEVLACTGEESCNGIPTCKWVVQELLKLGKEITGCNRVMHNKKARTISA